MSLLREGDSVHEVRKIVEVINKEGRQGPKDLKSKEVYNWVTEHIDITYEDYLNILKNNAIKDEDRDKNRDAFFTIEHGKYRFFKTRESEIRKYCCYVVKYNPHITSSEVINKVRLLYNEYTTIDLMEQKNLESKQDVINQTIRNIMVSNYDRRANYILFERSNNKPFTYTLKPDGLILANELEEFLENKKLEYLSEINPESISCENINSYSEEELSKINNQNKKFNYSDIKDKGITISQRVPTDERIKLTRFVQTSYTCEADASHITFATSRFPNFLEGHHLIPLSAQRTFPDVKLDCIQNMVSLCPNCHKKIHYAEEHVKLELFNQIIENRKSDFEEIGFTIDDLQEIFKNFY